MIFNWLKRRRRERILAAPFPAEWLEHLKKNVAVYDLLSPTQQSKLRDDLRIFIAEKSWEGCGGLTLTDEVKVAVAAQACLLVLGVEHDYFRRVETILVYPSAYRTPDGEVGPDGVVHEDSGRLGEAWHGGPVVLGWNAVRVGGQDPRDGRNLVFHEFAHQLDFLDGLADGTPPLRSAEQYRRWHEVMTAEYERLRTESNQGKATLLDDYGTTNPAEFFAVATECFFEQPVQMQKRHPDLYGVLSDYYCQKPAEWFNPPEKAEAQERRPFRGTRAAKKAQPTTTQPAIATNHPGWVRFWMLGTYWSREVAVDRVRMMFTLAAGTSLIAVLSIVGGQWTASAVLALSLVGVLMFNAIWLWLAVRWVDRHGWQPA